MADRPVFLYAAVYDEIADAEADYEAVFDLHAAGAIGTFDSAVIRKEADGKVRVTNTEKPTQHGVLTGAGVGALVGILFPPSILGSAIVGAGAGALTGYLTRATKRTNKLIEKQVETDAEELKQSAPRLAPTGCSTRLAPTGCSTVKSKQRQGQVTGRLERRGRTGLPRSGRGALFFRRLDLAHVGAVASRGAP
jgi:hypothetical protein